MRAGAHEYPSAGILGGYWSYRQPGHLNPNRNLSKRSKTDRSAKSSGTAGKHAEKASDGEKHIDAGTVATAEALERSRCGRFHSIGGAKRSIDRGNPSVGGAKSG